jgi:hypothetical protein
MEILNFWLVLFALSLPSLIALFGLTYWLGKTSSQRIAYLLIGLLVAIVFTGFCLQWIPKKYNISPRRWDDYFPWALSISMAIGSALGIGLLILVCRGMMSLFRKLRH